MTKWVYNFGDAITDGNAKMKDLLGGKGANLAEMCRIGLPVPPGFTITTEVCTYFYANDGRYPADLKAQVEAGVALLGERMGKSLGEADNPLLVSVRSGARISMPGMMDTVLNLGLNPQTVEGLAKQSKNPRFAYDSYRRFVQMYGNVVLGIDHDKFEALLDATKEEKELVHDDDLSTDDLKTLIAASKALVETQTNHPFPDDVHEQLWGAIGAVFGSWQIPRAKAYRQLNKIPEGWGTAVNIQAMVFGNFGETSATGVAFTRDPSTGENILYGEYLVDAQGEDVVAGIRTPLDIAKVYRERAGHTAPSMEETMPENYRVLKGIAGTLEKHFHEMQDMEFTVQEGKLYMLQCRTGKRTARAALKIAIDHVNEQLITKEEAVARIDPGALNQMLHPTLDPKAAKVRLVAGLAASPGAGVGEVVFSAAEAEALAGNGHKVILVRMETSPEDIKGMHVAKAILTARGGMTSHAAVVARGMGRPCVAGAGSLVINPEAGQFSVGEIIVKRGDVITVDGSSGLVYLGAVPMQQPELTGDFKTLMDWADSFRKLKVFANADTPHDAEVAIQYGAQGVGLCRTEHMFFEADRIIAVRQMILAENVHERKAALAKLLPMQRSDFEGILKAMNGLPVIIRLLDPPLHEFLPHKEEEFAAVAAAAGVTVEKLKAKSNALRETNPMLGHRGCRLGITYPEIIEMQTRAIVEAALNVEEKGIPANIEIMIPVVGFKSELDYTKSIITRTIDEIEYECEKLPSFKIGTMIELPRAALRADELAETAEFFSFGTNDLTQTTLGLSRDDAGTFLKEYINKDLLPNDPFVTIDRYGVGELIKIAAERGRKTRPDISIGICGEHGGDPQSIAFCHEVGLDYVSCSPFRVPVARLAAAQAALKNKADID